MIPVKLTSDDLVGRILGLSTTRRVALLDPCGPRGWGSGFLIAGIGHTKELDTLVSGPGRILTHFEEFEQGSPAVFFTISYELGKMLQGISGTGSGPAVFAAAFDAVVVHEYRTGRTFIEGGSGQAAELRETLLGAAPFAGAGPGRVDKAEPEFEMTRADYLAKIDRILALIRSGDTYQTNLTQKIAVNTRTLDPRKIFSDLRRSHPAAYSCFIERPSDHVISISPERFFRTGWENGKHRVIASPIKGTRPRASDPAEDRRLMLELAASAKDRAENIMITDLLRNDLGRVCEYGTVKVDSLCEVEELPSLFHLVSKISGEVRPGTGISDLLRALFPCGSITGCPKIRTMEIIDELEPSDRGLSMGSIGFSFDRRSMPELDRLWNPDTAGSPLENQRCYDVSVAIRTAVLRDGLAEFNVGGGIVIDSDPEAEYSESLDKAAAILSALGVPEEAVRNRNPTSILAEQST